MPVIGQIADLDAIFARSPGIVINDLPNRTEKDREDFMKKISVTYTSDRLSVLPSCACPPPGNPNFRGAAKVGLVCPVCNSPVKSEITEDIQPAMWFRNPVGVAPLLNPLIYIMLTNRFSKRTFNTILWLTDRNYRATNPPADLIRLLQENGIQRGYNFFYNNFDRILDILFNYSDFKLPKKNAYSSFIDMIIDRGSEENTDVLRELIVQNRHKLFSNYLPLPNASLLILEINALGSFMDFSGKDGRDAFNMMLSIDRDLFIQSPEFKENRTAVILYKNSLYIRAIFEKHFKPKEGLPRKNLNGTRCDFAFRAVITSHAEIMSHDEVFMPWGAALASLRLHLMNKLLDMSRPDTRMTHRQAVGFLLNHTQKYHPLLDQLLKELIEESPYKGLPLTMLRNPTLFQGSITLAYVTRVKTDPMDATVSVHDHSCYLNNGDFDGDEEMFSFTIDDRMTELLYPLSMFFSTFNVNAPLEVSKFMGMREPDVATIGHWMELN